MLEDTAVGNTPRTLISKITSSTSTRRSRDEPLAEIRQSLASVTNPAEEWTPRVLIRNILEGTDSGSVAETPAIVPVQRRRTVTPKSQTLEVAGRTRSATKMAQQSARSADIAHNSSDATDSFVLPRYRAGRRQVGKKERRKLTKADFEAFAAGAESILAAGEFPSTSESEVDVSIAARKNSASPNALRDSYAADSFVLPPYNAGRRILKKKRRVLGPEEARAFAKAVDEVKDDDNDWTTADESPTDSKSKSPKRALQNTPGSAKSSSTKGSIRKSLSRDINAAIETSHKSPSTSVAQNETAPKDIMASKTIPLRSSVDAAVRRKPDSDLEDVGSTAKQPSPRKSASPRVSSRSVVQSTSRDVVLSPSYLAASPDRSISRSASKNASLTPRGSAAASKRNSLLFGKNVLQEVVESSKDKNDSFSPKLSSTRITFRHSLSFQEDFSARFASRTNQSSRLSKTFEEGELVENLTSSRRSIPSSRVVTSGMHSKQSPSVHEPAAESVLKGDSSARKKSAANSESQKGSPRSSENGNQMQEIPASSSVSMSLPMQSSQRNKSTGSTHASLLTASPQSLLSFQEDSYSRPASKLNERSRKSVTREIDLVENPSSSSGSGQSPRTDRTGTRSKRSRSFHDQVEESVTKGDQSGKSKLNVDSSASTSVSARPSGNVDELPAVPPPTSASPISTEQPSPKNKSTESRHASVLFHDEFYTRPASRLSEHSKQENDFVEDPVISSGPLGSPGLAERSPSVHETIASVKKGDLSGRSKLNASGSTREKANDSKEKTDLNKSSRKSLMQSHLVFSPNSNGKLRYSNLAGSRVANTEADGGERQVKENESLSSAGRAPKDRRGRHRETRFSEESISDPENKKSNASRNTAKPSTSRRNDSDEDDDEPETRFRFRKRPVSPSENESDSSDTDKRLKVSPKTKKPAKGGKTARKPKVDEAFVPLSGTKANFEHFLQKRVIRPTAIEAQKQANRFFRMITIEMDKMMAQKPINKRHISPTEVKNMFIRLGLFESLDHLEMNARQWLDSDGQEMIIDYEGAFRNIKYD